MSNDKRQFERINVKIEGTLFINGNETPIDIVNISENGLGARIKYKYLNSQEIKEKDIVSLMFWDDKDFLINEDRYIQICDFRIIQIRRHTTHMYIGCQLIESSCNYEKYVEEKKASRFMKMIQSTKGEFLHGIQYI